MNNVQYNGGERNHYFYGKLMTVRDFENEQTYFNDKRRLGNRLLHGTGVVSGLGVLLTDNQTFSLEAGMALDYLGREIMVREPCVKRLSVIRGFDQIKDSGDVYLGIAYHEELCETTFAVSGGGSGSVSQEHNRVQEGYELFLTTRAPERSAIGFDHVLYDWYKLYQEHGVSITLQIPKYVNTEETFCAKVLFEKTNVSAPVRFSFRIESDLFQGENGQGGVAVEYTETEVTTHKSISLDYRMNCGVIRDDYSEIRVPADSFSLQIGVNQAETMQDSLIKAVEVTTRPLRDVVADAYYASHLDEVLTARDDQAIYLAKLRVILNQSTYFIEKIERDPFRQHLPSAQLLELLQRLEHPVNRGNQAQQQMGAAEHKVTSVPERTDKMMSGVETVLLGSNPKVGKSYFSHEFIHGLGAGTVGVTVAVENTEGLGSPDALVFGYGVFTAEEFSVAPPACAPAAMVNTKKGTIQLGLRLLEKTTHQSIRLRWWAWKTDEVQEEREELASEVQVIITPNTVNLEPLQQLRFHAVVDGSANQEVNWTVAEKNGGTIDRNGLYTAPAGEGVFEIQASSTKYGTCRASAYIVVGKL